MGLGRQRLSLEAGAAVVLADYKEKAVKQAAQELARDQL